MNAKRIETVNARAVIDSLKVEQVFAQALARIAQLEEAMAATNTKLVPLATQTSAVTIAAKVHQAEAPSPVDVLALPTITSPADAPSPSIVSDTRGAPELPPPGDLVLNRFRDYLKQNYPDLSKLAPVV